MYDGYWRDDKKHGGGMEEEYFRLCLELPPGTGDVQLEVCQSLFLFGAVAVFTPSALGADVRKGVEILESWVFRHCILLCL